MQGKYLLLSIVVMAALLVACASKVENPTRVASVTETAQTEKNSSSPPANCPVTTPQDPPFVPPPPYDQLGLEHEFWYGSHSLWTAVRVDGTWKDLPHRSSGYTQKVFWWREGYDREKEPKPGLTVAAQRIDAPAAAGESSEATNASSGDIGTAMLVGMNLPTPGCWKITGQYGDTELSFVVWVAP